MSLATGTRLGPYEVTGTLGSGGMGDVYRGRDARLKRDVALKVLPEDVAADPERLARFQREAEVLASLNHPHIAQIYGLEEIVDHDGRFTRALVMELVEGVTLEERIEHGAIPIHEARGLALQMIDALAFAHEHLVVHRDFKPSNVKLTPEGIVKVLDFGLAKALDPIASPGAGTGHSPTITTPAAMTRAGALLGTAAYMAPEQARGAAVDKRADIWAFGVVLHEMLTGRRLFGSETISDTLANVLKSDVDFSALPPETPPSMRRVLRRCLARDRKERLQDIGDARLDLADAGGASDARAETPVASPDSRFAWRAAGAGLVAGVALALIGAAAWMTPAEEAATQAGEPVTFLITPQDGVALDDPPVFAVSPDGQHILLRGTDRGAPVAFVRSLATGQLRRLDGTRGLSAQGAVAWSLDSQAVAFVRANALFRIGIDGLALERVYDERVNGLAWGR
ncbi:MAG: protein kinase domain-containing protein [Acidobacteriota bacterium]